MIDLSMSSSFLAKFIYFYFYAYKYKETTHFLIVLSLTLLKVPFLISAKP